MTTNVVIKWHWIDFDPSETKAKIEGRIQAKVKRKKFTQAVYVIRLKSPFAVAYPNRYSPTLYVGEGNVLGRLDGHRKWAKKLCSLGFNFPLEVAFCFPRVRNNASAYKTFEAHLLDVFSKRYESLPLKNSDNEFKAFDHQYDRVATGEVLGPRKGSKHMWAIAPLPANSFLPVFQRTHAMPSGGG